MQRFLTLAILIFLTASFASAQIVTERCWHLDRVQFLQQKQDFWRSHRLYTSGVRPYSKKGGGLYSLTEGQYGFGLNITDPPYANHFAGATTALGWRFGGGFAVGGGTGYLKYNEGYTIPLYADIRYIMGRQRTQFFFAMPAGFLFNFDNFKDNSRVFGNPSLGLMVPVSRNTHLSFSVGFFTQIDRQVFDDPALRGDWHDSFINLKLGLILDL